MANQIYHASRPPTLLLARFQVRSCERDAGTLAKPRRPVRALRLITCHCGLPDSFASLFSSAEEENDTLLLLLPLPGWVALCQSRLRRNMSSTAGVCASRHSLRQVEEEAVTGVDRDHPLWNLLHSVGWTVQCHPSVFQMDFVVKCNIMP